MHPVPGPARGTLAPGSRIAKYEILEFRDAGGMGEVYRARDARLGRDVAVKILRGELASDTPRLARFEREARAASALNHPNIVTVHEFGRDGTTPYLVMEWLDGETLRDRLAAGPFPPALLLDVAAQVAEGLAKAHGTGIVHRDLKPENVILTRDGFAKILDFGIAKSVAAPGSENTTLTADALPPALAGTVGYMSPEQASGRPVDFRSDQFSLGVILWEMAAGRSPFVRPSSVETLAAILNEPAEPLEDAAPAVPEAFRWAVERCLAKDPEERYSSTKDLALDLRRSRERPTTGVAVRKVPGPKLRPRRTGAGALALAVAAIFGAGGAWLATPRSGAPLPAFQRLTFRRGQVVEARFAPDDHTVVYDATWEGEPLRVFTTRIGRPESQPLAIESAGLQSVSGSGEVAVVLGARFRRGRGWEGTLARVPLSGGAPRSLARDVVSADWTPDGSLSVVRSTASGLVLEMPSGEVLYRADRAFDAKASPAGGLLCIASRQPDGEKLDLVTTGGKVRGLVRGLPAVNRYAWTRDGKEIWFTQPHNSGTSAFRAVNVSSGALRDLDHMGGFWVLLDVGAGGRVLAKLVSRRFSIAVGRKGSEERNLSWLDWSVAVDVSPRGDFVLIGEYGGSLGTLEGREPAIYLRGTDGSPAVRLAEGHPFALSPDGVWVLAETSAGGSSLSLIPTGAGESRRLPRGDVGVYEVNQKAAFFPEASRVVFAASRAGEQPRLSVQGTDGSEPRPFGPDGDSNPVVSEDGRRVAVLAPGQSGPEIRILDSDGHAVPGASAWPVGPEVRPLRFADASSLWIAEPSDGATRLELLSLKTGVVRFVREIKPADPAGVFGGIWPVLLSRDAETTVASYSRILSDLYVIDGLR